MGWLSVLVNSQISPTWLSIICQFLDKITVTLSRPKGITQTMSGLLVSENKKTAILFRAEDPAGGDRKDKDGTLDTTIYAFDLQVAITVNVFYLALYIFPQISSILKSAKICPALIFIQYSCRYTMYRNPWILIHMKLYFLANPRKFMLKYLCLQFIFIQYKGTKYIHLR